MPLPRVMVSGKWYPLDRHIMLQKLIPILFLVVLTLAGSSSYAQEEAPGQEYVPRAISLYHSPPFTAEDLPNPGMPVELSVQLSNTRDTGAEMIALVVRDGALLQINPEKIYLNEYDNPEYIFNMHAPHGDINYQFLLFPKDSDPIISEKFILRRDCLPPIELVDIDVDSKAHGRELLIELVYRARSLEKEYRAYEEARALLTEVFQELDSAADTN